MTKVGNRAFTNCAFKEIKIPNGITSIGVCVFESCYNLEKFTFPDDWTSTGDCILEYCENLKEVKIPNNIKTIGNRAFYNCVKLKNINIPEGVEIIRTEAFDNHYSSYSYDTYMNTVTDRNIILPKTIKTLESYALSTHYATTSGRVYTAVPMIKYRGTKEDWKKIAFSDTSSDNAADSTEDILEYPYAYDSEESSYGLHLIYDYVDD